jgi:hypothetical protein
MSTRATIWYSEKIHIYEELLEDDFVHVEYDNDGVTINIPLMKIDEWKSLVPGAMKMWQHDETGRICHSVNRPSEQYTEIIIKNHVDK